MEQKVPAIENGIVIDHIPVQSTLKVVKLLELGSELVTFGNNLSSSKMGKKGLVKISDKYLTKAELGKISLVAPDAMISIIKDYKVIDKKKVDIPAMFDAILTCFNPKCITRHEPARTKFYVLSKNPLKIRCHHCESVFWGDQIKI